MRIRNAVLGAAAVVAVAGCGAGTASSQDAAPTTVPTATRSTTAEPTTTQPTTTTPTTTTTAKPTTTVEPTTTRPPRTTATRPTTSEPRTTTAKPPATSARPVGLAKGTPCKATARACIDLSANKSWLIEDGKAVYGPVPITHGRPGWETPPGTFRVGWKNRHHRSSIFNNAPMPYSVFFNGGIAFHEGSLQEESHGCIHLSRTAAARYFNTLQVGDVVQVVR